MENPRSGVGLNELLGCVDTRTLLSDGRLINDPNATNHLPVGELLQP